MNWEKSKALTPLKRDFLISFFMKEKRFFLTGGSALGIFYLEHRISYDLDLFSCVDFNWLEIDGTLRLISSEIGASLSQIRTAPTFRRYQLIRGEETEIIDLVRELCQQIDKKKEQFDDIRTDTIREILINKICTLLSRCETKDLIDLYFLTQKGFHVEQYLEDAKMKDAGLEPAVISMLLSQVKIKELPEYLLKPLSLEDLQAFVEELRLKLAQIAYPDSGQSL